MRTCRRIAELSSSVGICSSRMRIMKNEIAAVLVLVHSVVIIIGNLILIALSSRFLPLFDSYPLPLP